MAVKAGQVEVDVVVNSDVARGLSEAVAEAEAAVRKIGGMEGDAKANLDTSELVAKAAEAQAIIKALNGQDAKINVEVDEKGLQQVTKDLGRLTDETVSHAETVAKLRSRYAELYTARKRANDVDFGRKTAREKLEMDKLDTALLAVGHRIRSLGGDTRDLNVDLDKNGTLVSRLRRGFSQLGRTRLSLGPISGSLKQLAVGASLLSPLLIGLVGSASALVGAIGSGLVGAFGVAAGAVTGLGIAALGLLPSLKALFAEAKAAPSIGGALTKLRDSLTGGIRPQFLQAAHSAIKTLQADFPTFQRGADNAFKAASTGFQSWMKGLRSPEAQGILQNLLGNVTKDLGPAMAGLGSLATAFGRFVSIASGSGPGIAKTFQNWAAGIEHSTQAGQGFGAKVQALVSQAKSLGSALSATGRLAIAFFGSGAKSGQDLLDSLTRSENRMTAWMHTVGGQNSLHQFFQDSVASTKALFSAVAPLISTFVRLGNALSPVTTGALRFATFIGDIVHAVAQLAPARVTLQGFGAALAGIFVINKVSGAIGGIRGLLAAVGLIAGEESAATAATAANTAALEANTAALAGNAAANDADAAALGARAAATDIAAESSVAGEAATAGFGARLATFAGTAAGVATGVGLLGGAAALLAIHFRHADSLLGPFNANIRDFYKGNRQATAATQALNTAQQRQANTEKSLNQLTQKGKTGTEEFAKAYDNHIASVNASQSAQTRQQAGIRAQTTAISGMQQKYESLAQTVKQDQFMKGTWQQGTLENETRALSDMSRQLNLAKLNFNRFQHGLGPVGSGFLQSINRLKGAAGQKIALKFELSGTPAVLNHLAQVTQRAKALGQTKAVMHILANSSNAEQAASRVDALIKHIPASHNTQIQAAAGGAQSVIQGVLGLLNSIPSVVTSVINVVKHVAGGSEGGVFPGYAGGGAHDRMMERAYQRASKVSGLNPDGGATVRSPRYVVGEEAGRTEYIISDNPAYKRSNLDYLAMAASALGQMIVPGYASGGARAASKKKKKAPPFSGNLDDATASDSYYQQLEDLTAYDASVADLVRRRYDLGQGPTINDVVGALGTEIADYKTLLSVINTMITGPAAQTAAVPPVPKKAKTKGQKKAKKQAQVQHDAAVAHNSAIKSDYENLLDEARTIRDITIPGLQLDQLEAQNAASTNTILGQETSNATRYSLYKQFASNVIGGVVAGASASAGQSTQAALPSFSSATPTGPSLASATSGAPVYHKAAAASGGVTINQTFAAPPPDAHTWSKNAVFEISAAGA